MEVNRFKLQGLIGLPYDQEVMTCGHLVALGLQRLFGRDVAVPAGWPHGRLGQAKLIEALAEQLTERVDLPDSGDVGLYLTVDPETGLDYYHLGLVLVMAGERWLLHVCVGERSRLQREGEACQRGMRLDGYYRLRQEGGRHGDACGA